MDEEMSGSLWSLLMSDYQDILDLTGSFAKLRADIAIYKELYASMKRKTADQ